MTAHEGASRKQAAVTDEDRERALAALDEARLSPMYNLRWLAALIAQVREDAARDALERAAGAAKGERIENPMGDSAVAYNEVCDAIAAAIRSLMTQHNRPRGQGGNMLNGHFSQHWSDAEGRPAGGVSSGRGFTISWQNGPLGRGAERVEPNGAFVEDVLQAVIERIEFYQDSRFACAENADALDNLRSAAQRLDDRTRNREARAVEGTHKE